MKLRRLCEDCKKEPATVHLSQITDGGLAAERHLCERCASKEHADMISQAEAIPIDRVLDAGTDLAAQARDAIISSAEIKRCFAERASADVARAAQLVADCLRTGGKVLLCGNGGSAAEAQHIAGELVGRFELERRAFHAVALTTDTSILTALANDYTFDRVFARQVEALGAHGDVLLAYSTSGNSANVVEAIETAKARGMKAVGFTGASGGAMADLCDVCIQAPSDDTPVVQECHTVAGHTICRFVEKMLCAGD
jgi:D-sedoheptulose 7-phosphate isomerase